LISAQVRPKGSSGLPRFAIASHVFGDGEVRAGFQVGLLLESGHRRELDSCANNALFNGEPALSYHQLTLEEREVISQMHYIMQGRIALQGVYERQVGLRSCVSSITDVLSETRRSTGYGEPSMQVLTHDDAVSILDYFDGLDDPRSSVIR
jgi:hypothetical protein